jgi:hypothetical protein
MNAEPIFKKHQIMPGESRILSSGNFSLGVKREKEGWILLYPDYFTKNEGINPDFSQGEYFQTGKSNSLILTPALPDKPLVFKGSQLHVSPGQRLTFFLKIPLTLQVYFSKILPGNMMKELPTRRLSDSWFGDPFNGEPAFLLGSEFSRFMDITDTSFFDAVCPVTIFNNSSIVLEVERLIIRVENLTLYQKDNKMITSQVAIEYKGKEVISSVGYHSSKLYHGEKAEIIARPRNEASKNLLKINFHFIKNLYRQES